MNKIIAILVLIIIANPLYADEISKETKSIIDELLVLTKAIEISEMMGVGISNQIIQSLSESGKKKIDQEVIDIIKDEVEIIFNNEFIENGFLHQLSYDIYNKYFTTKELKELVAFYKTDTGKKLTEHLPSITQESMLAGQKHAESLGPLINQRLQERLKNEGVLK